MGCFFTRWVPALFFLLAGVLSASPVTAVTVLAPTSGAVVGEARIVISGRAGGPTLQASLNGRGLPAAPVSNGFFAIPVTLAAGVNRLGLQSGQARADVTVEYRAGGQAYRFHPGYAEGECGDCHENGIGPIGTVTHSSLCHSCHDSKDGARFLHGPVGAGQCVFCHDPHGSAEKAFLTRGGTDLCVACHDQPEIRGHMNKKSDRACVDCHNPHGSEKKFFLY